MKVITKLFNKVKNRNVVRKDLRSAPDLAWMEGNTAVVLNDKITNNESFTKYDITTILRDQFPQFNIQHGQVKAYVEKLMLPLLAQGFYEVVPETHPHEDGGLVEVMTYKPV